MTAPRIVVVMSVFNEELYLEDTIPALLDQTMPDFQLVALDNGSTDRTWQILRGFNDPRITLLRSPTNLTPPRVMNLLAGLAFDLWRDCNWILSAGADDIVTPDYLAAVLDVAERNPDVNCIYSPNLRIGAADGTVHYYPPFDPSTIADVCQIPAWRAITRELWDAVGEEDESVGPGSDWSWIVRATAKGVLRPVQLFSPCVLLRTRENGRVTQSEEVDFPTLHGHLRWVAEHVR